MTAINHIRIHRKQEENTLCAVKMLARLFLCAGAFLSIVALHPSAVPNDEACATKKRVNELLAMNSDEFVKVLGEIYEHSPWVAEALVDGQDPNPNRKVLDGITTVSGLAGLMKVIVEDAPPEKKLELLRAHPDLAQKLEALKDLTPESQEEQSSAGLQSMTSQELDQFQALNTRYKAKFPFPFILAVRHSTKHTVLSALEGRLSNSIEQETATALEQVHKIAWMRLLQKVESDEPAGFLTCHVLDTANGIPAAKMKITLTRLSPPESAGLVGTFITNADGRLEGGPALKGEHFVVGTYEWVFYAGDYFASQGTRTAGTLFLDEIPLRFGIDNPDDHYHVPLLVSPWSYSTYRGS